MSDRPADVTSTRRWLLLVVAGAGFVLLWGLPTIIIPLATDQVMFALGARTILDGGQLYADRIWSDPACAERIQEPFLRDFTQAASEASVPGVLGGPSLVAGGLMLLNEAAWREEDKGSQAEW